MRVANPAAKPAAKASSAARSPKNAAKSNRAAKAKRADAFERAPSRPRSETVEIAPKDFAQRPLSELLADLQQVAHELANKGVGRPKRLPLDDPKAHKLDQKLQRLEEQTGLRTSGSRTTTAGHVTREDRFAAGLSGLEGGRTSTFQSGPSVAGQGQRDTPLGHLAFQGRAAAEILGSKAGSARLDARGVRAQGRIAGSVGAKAEGRAHLEGRLGEADASGEAAVEAFGEAQGDLALNRKGLVASGEAKVGVEARARANVRFQSAGIDVGGERLDLRGEIDAFVEASAKAEGKVTVAATIHPPRVEAEVGGKAFAGVKAGVEARFGLGSFVTVTGHADAWAGAGAEARGVVAFRDGVLRLKFGAGAAVGVGAGVSGEIDVDVKRMAKAALHQAGDLFEHGFGIAFRPPVALSDLRNLHVPLGSKQVAMQDEAQARMIAMQIVLSTMTRLTPPAVRPARH